MEVIGAVVVFLLGAAVGLLVALYLLAARVARSVEAQITDAAERAEAQITDAAERAAEQRAHLDATAAIVVDRLWLVGAGLAAEIREMAAVQRNDLRLAVGLPAVEVPGGCAPRRSPSRASSAPPSSPPMAASSRATFPTPHAGTPAASRPTRAAAPGVWTVGDDEPTPPSGWTLDEVRERTQHDAERS